MEDFKEEAIELIGLTIDYFNKYKSSYEPEERTKLYSNIYRLIKSLKGSSGLLGQNALHRHMTLLEKTMMGYGEGRIIPSEICDHYISAMDVAKKIALGGDIDETYNYSYLSDQEQTQHNSQNLISMDQILNEDLPVVLLNIDRDIFFSLKDAFENQDIYEISDLSSLNIKDLNAPIVFLVKEKDIDRIEEFLGKSIKMHIIIIVERHHNSRYLFWEESLGTFSLKTMIEKLYKEKLYRFYFQKAMTLLIYQYSDLEKYLESSNQQLVLKTLKEEISSLLRVQSEVLDHD